MRVRCSVRRGTAGLAAVAGVVAGLAASPVSAQAGLSVPASNAWVTYHRDPGRSGADPDSTVPVPFAVSWTSPNLDGPLYGQPVVLGNTVVAVTESNSVYGLDATTGQVRWQRSAGTPVPASALPCGDIGPTVGITSTPVIDPATGGVYTVADTWDGSHAHHVLVGYDVVTGAPLLGAGIAVDPPGATPEALLQRAALNLTTGSGGDEVVLGYGGNAGDCGTYRGWVAAAPVNGSAPRFFAATTTPGGAGAVWAPGGAAVDADGSVFAATGNGFGSPATNQGSENVVHLDPQLTRLDAFWPSDWQNLDSGDTDIGSATPQLVGGGLLYQNGKGSTGYLLSTGGLGGPGGQRFSASTCPSFGADALAGGVLYLACSDGVRALSINTAAPSFSVLWHGPSAANGPPIVAGGLVWVVASGSGTLYGLDPASGQPRVTQMLGAVEHFTSPSAAGGQLFVATAGAVRAFRIAQPPPVPSTPTPTPTPTPTTPTTTPVAPPRAPVRVGQLALGHSAHVRRGCARLTLRCLGPGTCSGVVGLRLRVGVRHGHHVGLRQLSIGRARFRLVAGRSGVRSIRLDATARHALARRRRLPVTVVIRLAGAGRPTIARVVLLA